MSWTDDRVARLSKLWAEGLSASQIAAELGGVTRNAVIGKVHRLGLSGRIKPSSSARPKRVKPRANGGMNSRRPSPRYNGGGSAALKLDIATDAVAEIDRRPVEDVVVPISKRLTLLQLNENTCKFPHGDPQGETFYFCGQTSKDEAPYCEYHCKVAFQPASERRRRR